MINKLSDLQIGCTYYVCLVKDIRSVKTATVLAIINEEDEFKSDKTELFLKISQTKKYKTLNLLYAQEVGIGLTKKEAINNFRRFKYEDVFYALNSYKKAITTTKPLCS